MTDDATQPNDGVTPHDETIISEHAAMATVEARGTQIDRYRLVEPLGEGGFGVVWLAEQREPVRRQVALKIIKLGMDTRQVIGRFEAERQALALMDHPGIAKVFDAGATSSGRPYFVMELVRGVPVTDYCDRESLSTKRRLQLFIDVCHAVQHAHQKGIIHRDIKPSNVMVTLHDDKPVVKVIDFGIAKATNAELTEKTVFTELRQFIGTPEYMSPEQAEMSGLDIDTRSDIYSLGVLLYELLTGVTPFDPHKLRRAGLNEIQRIIREEEPVKPSTRLSELSHPDEHETAPGSAADTGSSLDDIAKHRRTDPAHLTRELRGDLDWIVMKALEKSRLRRYETANGLAMDVLRYLKHEPVMAGPPTAGYRLRKFITRHRGPVAAGIALAVVLVLGVIGTTWGMVWAMQESELAETAAGVAQAEAQRASDAATLAENEARRAEKEARTARRVTEFVTGLFEASDPFEAQGKALTAAEILQMGADRIDELDDEPGTQAALRETIGYVYVVLGQFDLAESLLEPAAAYREAHAAEDELALANCLQILANLYQNRGDPDQGLPVIERAIEIQRRLLGDSSQVAMSLNTLGNCRWHLGELAEAERIFREAIAIQDEVLPADHMDKAMPIHNLGAIRYFSDDPAEAEQLWRQAMAIEAANSGTENHAYATSMHTVSIVCMDQGRLREALKLQEEALGIRERVLGQEHWHVALSLTVMGNIRRDLSQPHEAEPFLRRAAQIALQSWGPEHPELWWMRRSLAAALVDQKRLSDARAELLDLLAVIDATGDEESRIVPLIGLAKIERLSANLDQAETQVRRALEIALSVYGPEDNYVAAARGELANVLAEHGRSDQADREFTQALDVLESVYGETDPDRLRILRERGAMLVRAERPDDAYAAFEALFAVRRAMIEMDQPEAHHLQALAALLLHCEVVELRDAEEAVGLAEQACDLTERKNVAYLLTLAEAHAATDAVADARAALQAALDQLDDLDLRRQDIEERLRGLDD